MSDDNFLSRWSRRKHQANKEPAPPTPAAPQPLPAVAPPNDLAPSDGEAPEPLQAVASLTPESDFTPFMNAKVDPETRRQALKTLFTDPRFNVMDGLDVYIDDYSKADPLPAGWLEKMHQFAYLGDRGERDREEAAKAEAAAGTQPPVPPAGNIEQEQPLATARAPDPSPTPGAVPPPSEPQETAGKASG